MLPRPTTHSKALGPGVAGPELAIPTSAVLDRPPAPTAQRPLSGAAAFSVDPSLVESADGPRQHTQYPYVTGTSVLAVKFAGGVMLAADTLGAYGSTKRYKSLDRIARVNGRTLIAAGGEVSDFQYILRLLEELATDDFRAEDGLELGPREVHSYLCRVMYNRRGKMDPLWNTLVVGGVEADGTPFLGTVGMIGTHYVDSHVATGFGAHLARPLFRERQDDDMSADAAEALLRDALRVCYYRDKASINKFVVATATASGVEIGKPFALDTKWDFKAFEAPTKWAIGTW